MIYDQQLYLTYYKDNYYVTYMSEKIHTYLCVISIMLVNQLISNTHL